MALQNITVALNVINAGLSLLEIMTVSNELLEKVSTMIATATAEKRQLTNEELQVLIADATAADDALQAELDEPDPPAT